MQIQLDAQDDDDDDDDDDQGEPGGYESATIEI